jgi:hypothetical protein
MHWEAMIDRVWPCTLRPKSSVLRDSLRGDDPARMEQYFEAVDWGGGAMATETLFFGLLVIVGI